MNKIEVKCNLDLNLDWAKFKAPINIEDIIQNLGFSIDYEQHKVNLDLNAKKIELPSSVKCEKQRSFLLACFLGVLCIKNPKTFYISDLTSLEVSSFADHILMPTHLIVEEIYKIRSKSNKVKLMALKFNVPDFIMENRLRTLKLLEE